MSYTNVPQTSLPRARTTWRVAYKVALGVAAVGVLMIVLSPFFGGLLYTRAITPLLDILGGPEEREFLPRSEPQTGAEILALLGGCNLVVGICMFCVRLVLELLGLAGEPGLTRRLGTPGKLALGTAAAGVVVFAAGAFPGMLVSLLLIDYESEVLGMASALDVISQAGRLLLLCALITLFLGGDDRRGALLRWTEVVGWGKIRCGWINRLALALVLGGTISLIPFFWTPWMPFDDVAGVFARTGVVVLVLGVVPQFLAGGRP